MAQVFDHEQRASAVVVEPDELRDEAALQR
jgi:hypothetical protein